jgi:hypothetical protein
VYDLKSHPHLEELFNDLVIRKKSMTEKEFWEHHAHLTEADSQNDLTQKMN